MAVFVLEDVGASIEVTLFPRTLTEQGHKLADDVIIRLGSVTLEPMTVAMRIAAPVRGPVARDDPFRGEAPSGIVPTSRARDHRGTARAHCKRA